MQSFTSQNLWYAIIIYYLQSYHPSSSIHFLCAMLVREKEIERAKEKRKEEKEVRND